MISWIEFIICSVGIIWCGYRASYLGDILCEKTNVSKTIMGFAILAIATSAPEFVTSGASIVVVGIPDFAAGDLFGSIIFNLGIIAALDLIEGEGPLMLRVHTKQILYAGWTVIFLGIAALFIMIRMFTTVQLSFLGMGAESFLLLFLLPFALVSIFKMEQTSQKDAPGLVEEKVYQHLKLRATLIKFIFYLGVIIALGIWLSQIGEQIVKIMGWSEVLVGTFFLAIVTSLPELIVSISALRFDVDMAVGNILGSNFFDMMIIPLCDALFRGGAFLSSIQIDNLFTVVLAMLVLNIVIVGLICRSKRCFMRLGWDAIAMLFVLVGGSSLLIYMAK